MFEWSSAHWAWIFGVTTAACGLVPLHPTHRAADARPNWKRSGQAAAARLAAGGLAEDVTRIVATMQFQDITTQRVEHVCAPLARIDAYLRALLAGETPPPEELQAPRRLEDLEHRYTMDEERRVLRRIIHGRDDGPAPASAPSSAGNITLF